MQNTEERSRYSHCETEEADAFDLESMYWHLLGYLNKVTSVPEFFWDPGVPAMFNEELRTIVPKEKNTSSPWWKGVACLEKKMAFGDVALIQDVPRTATICCVERSLLLVVSKEDYQVIKDGAALRKQLERLEFIKNMYVFQQCSYTVIMNIANLMQHVTCERGTEVCGEGRPLAAVSVIHTGECSMLSNRGNLCARGHQQRYGEPQVAMSVIRAPSFVAAEDAIRGKTCYSATVVAITHVVLYSMSLSDLLVLPKVALDRIDELVQQQERFRATHRQNISNTLSNLPLPSPAGRRGDGVMRASYNRLDNVSPLPCSKEASLQPISSLLSSGRSPLLPIRRLSNSSSPHIASSGIALSSCPSPTERSSHDFGPLSVPARVNALQKSLVLSGEPSVAEQSSAGIMMLAVAAQDPLLPPAELSSHRSMSCSPTRLCPSPHPRPIALTHAHHLLPTARKQPPASATLASSPILSSRTTARRPAPVDERVMRRSSEGSMTLPQLVMNVCTFAAELKTPGQTESILPEDQTSAAPSESSSPSPQPQSKLRPTLLVSLTQPSDTTNKPLHREGSSRSPSPYRRSARMHQNFMGVKGASTLSDRGAPINGSITGRSDDLSDLLYMIKTKNFLIPES
ncbi:hypothetical protein CYMTET_14130 [Cymbomonas tetramitiformis]|uniref:Cyclic nucleotide-binding domain-containing protein n=1 Tax=Cymbomonas tetramitiformis TaxID=36881 RepID=A0AAE0LAB8_9CHLO|nr:hypothetical protein CYMTET_14130 [Cymbomonas tetramitiformis]